MERAYPPSVNRHLEEVSRAVGQHVVKELITYEEAEWLLDTYEQTGELPEVERV